MKIGQHILSIEGFTRHDLQYLRELGDILKPVARRELCCSVLNGALMANLFFEASTRTRLSFHTAFARLGGAVSNTTGFTFSSLSKGESIADTARVIAGYADAIVMRHPERGSVAEFAAGIHTPVINAGDGTGEHPTQALLDYYTIYREFKRLGKKIDGMSIALLGDLKHGRTIHSLAKLLSLFNDVTFNLVSPDNLQLPPALAEHLRDCNHRVKTHDAVRDAISAADVIYATRIQKERFASTAEMPEGYSEQFRLNRAVVERFAPKDAIIMHPLPRDSREGAYDLNCDLDKMPQLAIFRQADNGVVMRMALFAAVLGVDGEIENYFSKPRWWRPESYGVLDADFYRRCDDGCGEIK